MERDRIVHEKHMEAKSETAQPQRARPQETHKSEVSHTEFRSNSPPIPTLMKKEEAKKNTNRPRVPTETYEKPAPRRQEALDSYEQPPREVRKTEVVKPANSNDSSAVLQQLQEIQRVCFDQYNCRNFYLNKKRFKLILKERLDPGGVQKYNKNKKFLLELLDLGNLRKSHRGLRAGRLYRLFLKSKNSSKCANRELSRL
jgi:hypothetical protein